MLHVARAVVELHSHLALHPQLVLRQLHLVVVEEAVEQLPLQLPLQLLLQLFQQAVDGVRMKAVVVVEVDVDSVSK